MFGAPPLAYDLAQSPLHAFSRLQRCTIHDHKFEDEMEIWGVVLASGTDDFETLQMLLIDGEAY